MGRYDIMFTVARERVPSNNKDKERGKQNEVHGKHGG